MSWKLTLSSLTLTLFALAAGLDEECPKLVEYLGNKWYLTKIYEGRVSSLALNEKKNVYFLADDLINVFSDGKAELFKFETKQHSSYVRDLTSDSKGNIYFGANGYIDVLWNGIPSVETIMRNESNVIKYLTVDKNDNLLALANTDDYVYRAYFVDNGRLYPLPTGESIHTPFVLDSLKNQVYLSSAGTLIYIVDYMQLYNPDLITKAKTLAVDPYDNVLYSTESGLYVVEKGRYSSPKKVVDIPNISRIVAGKGYIYLSSADLVHGGIYLLQD